MIVLKDGNCEACAGCGYVANDDDATPWKYWADLPQQSAVAIQMGLVKPVLCSACNGTGEPVDGSET